MKQLMFLKSITTSVIVLTVFLFISCSKENEIISPSNSNDAKMKIQSIVSGGLTRSVKEQFREGDRISFNVTGGNFNTPYDAERENLYTKKTAIYQGGSWVLDTDILLNKNNATVYAHYPVSDKILLDMDKQVDYLVGKQIETTVNSAYPTVNISMKHACSLLQFKFKQEDYNGNGLLTAVRIKNGSSKNYIVSKAEWDFVNDRASHNETGDNSVVIQDPGGILTLQSSSFSNSVPVFIIPTLEKTTHLGDIYFEFTIDGKEYSWMLPSGFEFINGYIYNYEITLNSVGLQIGNVSIVAWETVDGNTSITITN